MAPQLPDDPAHPSGTTRIDVTMGEAIPVANVSFDPGYSLDTTLNAGGVATFKKADLVRGYCDYGAAIGEAGKGQSKG